MKKLILLLLLIPNLVIAETWICTNEDKKFTFKRDGDRFLVNETRYALNKIQYGTDYYLQIYGENDWRIWLIANPEDHIGWVQIYQLNKVYKGKRRNKLLYRFLPFDGKDKVLELSCGVSG